MNNLKTLHQKIWDLALPHQDKREDIGHAQITLEFAQKLIKLEGGDEDVIIPAIILHDTGYSQMDPDAWKVIFDKTASREAYLDVRYQHQDEGVKLARKILAEVEYPQDKIEEICEIISQHDTRDGFISKNEGLVRDADKLWRFSKTGFEADLIRNNFTFQQLKDKMVNKKLSQPNFLYSDSAKKLALKELDQREEEYKD